MNIIIYHSETNIHLFLRLLVAVEIIEIKTVSVRTMFPFEKQRVEARKRLLNRYDVTTFDSVPNFIVNGFFDGSSYANQLIVCTFGFLNGIEIDQLISLVQWKNVNESRKKKMKALYIDFETKPEYRERYYSFNVCRKLVMFLNGDIRKFTQRIVVTN